MSSSLARIADALGVTEQQLRDIVREQALSSPDPTLVALTVEEAARRIGVGRTTMYALIASGAMRSVQIGRLRRIPAQALNDYIAAQERSAASTTTLAA